MGQRILRSFLVSAAALLLCLMAPVEAMAQQDQITLGQVSFTNAAGQSLTSQPPVPGTTVVASVPVTANADVSGVILIGFFDPTQPTNPDGTPVDGSQSTNLLTYVTMTAGETQTLTFNYPLPINAPPGVEPVQVTPFSTDFSADLGQLVNANFTVVPPPGPITLGTATITPGTVFPGNSVSVSLQIATNTSAVANDPLIFAFYDPSQPTNPDGTPAPGAQSNNVLIFLTQDANTVQSYTITYQQPSDSTLGTEPLVITGFGPNFQSLLAGGAENASLQVVAPPPPPALAIDSGSINPLTIVPGGAPVNLSIMVTANQSVSGDPIIFSVFPPGSFNTQGGVNILDYDGTNSLVYETLQAGQNDTVTVPFSLPATDGNGNPTPNGQYLLQVSTWAPGFTAILDLQNYLFDAAPAPSGAALPPGPNLPAYQAPFYSCTRNFYIDAANGSDQNSGTLDLPWQTIQAADSSSRQAGDCINVAPGTYQNIVTLENGGNAPTPSGYVVYRCEALDECHVLAPSGTAGPLWRLASPGNFVAIDGFELDGNGHQATICLGATFNDNQDLSPPNDDTVHHLWALNNIAHDCALGGITQNNSEWFYVLYNTVYDNSWTSQFEGSGIGVVVAQCIEANNASCTSGPSVNGVTTNDTTGTFGSGTYVPSGMDLTFMPPYHIVIGYNNVFSNSEALDGIACGNHTDGNGIIIDTLQAEIPFNQGTSIPFPFQTLVTGNSSAFNGGRGVHVFRSSKVTVANNTAYGNGTDDCLGAFFLGDFSEAGGQNNIWIDNISQSVLSPVDPTCEGEDPNGIPGQTTACGGRQAPFVAGDGGGFTDTNNTYVDNIFNGGNGVQAFNDDIEILMNAPNFTVNPDLNNSASGDFSLAAGSPAIGASTQITVNGQALPASPVPPDLGACANGLQPCPAPIPFAPRLAAALAAANP
jgi:hypothetical protein